MTQNQSPKKPGFSTRNDAEIEQFDRLAAEWWDESGPFKPLHRLNPVRMAYIRDQFTDMPAPRSSKRARHPLSGLRIADIGCGGGIVSEPLARMGAHVTGVDAGAENIAAARRHAEAMGLTIDYKAMTAEDLAATKAQFDAVTALEIIEHVEEPAFFVAACASLLKPGGRIVLSTLNRTPASFALGIVAAEYVLGWVPRGTHDWRKFVRPSELARMCEDAGLRIVDITGMVYRPVNGTFSLSKTDVAVNYFLSAVKD